MFESGTHVGENAELYALGQLSEAERAHLESHVRECGECASRVGEAESTVLRLIETESAGNAIPLHRPGSWHTPRTRAYAPWIGALAAIAAAFILGLLVPKGVSPPQPAVETAMLEGHFLHAAFVPDIAGAPAAKVIYARDGAWYYVLVAAASRPLHVVLVSGTARHDVASIAPGSSTRSAFIRENGRFDAVEIDDDGAAVATAKLVYPR